MPGARGLLECIAGDLQQMAAPVVEADRHAFSARLDALLAAMPKADDDMLQADAVAAMTRAGKPGADSLHQLVMDLHRR